jgi:hypothetical protein
VQQYANITAAQHSSHEAPREFLQRKSQAHVRIRKNPCRKAREPEELVKEDSRSQCSEKSE